MDTLLRGSPASDWEETKSYRDFVVGTYDFVKDNIERTRTNYTFPDDTRKDFGKVLSNLTTGDVVAVLVLTVVWTVLRHLSTTFVFEPIGRYCRLPATELAKVPESAWKFSFYLFSWSAVASIVLFEDYFYRPSTIWEDYSMNLTVPSDVHVIYLVQISFYVHSLYATLFVDRWRRDSLVLIAHHLNTVILLVFTLSVRCHRSGIIAIFLHDMCDVLLEGTKTLVYFKRQGGQSVKACERLADIGFVCFAVTWFVSRLYWFPLRLVYFSSVYLHQTQKAIQIPFVLFLNFLLYALLAMNIYWFSFILNLLYKVVTGQVLEDNRDYEEQGTEADSKKQDHREEAIQSNGSRNDHTADEGLGPDDKSGYFLRRRKDIVSAEDEVVGPGRSAN